MFVYSFTKNCKNILVIFIYVLIVMPSSNGAARLKLCPSAKPSGRRYRHTTYDWISDREADVRDDGTTTFFWRAHTLSVLFFMTCYLIYIAVIEPVTANADYNAKRGLGAVVVVFLLFGVTQTPDGPFKRPHPALWRFVFCCTIAYELALIFMLFQTADDARQYLTHFDVSLGRALPEKDYGGNCRIYDFNASDNPWHNVYDKLDVFVPIHFFGFWIKTLVVRDVWLNMVMSVMFECLEYSLEHQLLNFSECWWDHWILDVLLCNSLGIYCGMLTLRYLKLKKYNWSGLWNIPSLRGKVKRFAEQFTPYSWMSFDWRPLQSFKRFSAVMGVLCVFLLAELNAFYLKFVLWLPPAHYLNFLRVVLLVSAGAVAMREEFQFLDDPTCKKFGRQSWVVSAIIITETLIIVKFGWTTIRKPLPNHILVFWLFVFISVVSWSFYNFWMKPYLWPHVYDFRSASRPLAQVGAVVKNGAVPKKFDDEAVICPNNDDEVNFRRRPLVYH